MKDNLQAAARRTVSHTLRSGKTIYLSTLGFKDFASMQAQCLAEYRRDKLRFWTENADLLPDDKRDEKIDQAFQRAEKLTYEDLPQKLVPQPVRDPENGRLKRDDSGEIVQDKSLMDYMQWWACATYAGMLFSTLRAMHYTPSQLNYTEDDVDSLFRDRTELDEVHEIVGEVSTTQLDFPQAPRTEGTEKKRRRRRRRGR